MAFFLRLSLASNGWGSADRLKGSKEISIADLLDMDTGKIASNFGRFVAGVKESWGLSNLNLCKDLIEAMAVGEYS